MAASEPKPSSVLAARWMKANVVGAIASVAVGLLCLGLDQMIGGNRSLAVAFGRNVVVAGLFGFSGFVWALFTGAVLQRIISMLPVRRWLVLNTALSAVMALSLVPANAVSPDTTSSPDMSPFVAMLGGVVIGAIIGAMTGGLQALILRRVATGVGAWILWSSVSCAACFAVLVWIGTTWVPESSEFNLIVTQTVGALTGILSAAVMLPAVFGLRPRSE